MLGYEDQGESLSEKLSRLSGKKGSPSCRLGRKLNVNISFSDLCSYVRK